MGTSGYEILWIHAGGRGKGRFVTVPARRLRWPRKAKMSTRTRWCSPRRVSMRCARVIHAWLDPQTKQTAAGGQTVRTIYIESGCRIATEMYVVLLD